MTDKARADEQARFAVDDRELDEAFSAWDEDDALARRPPPGSTLASGSDSDSDSGSGSGSTLAQTRVGRRPLGGATSAGAPSPARAPAGVTALASDGDATRSALGPAATAAAAAAALEHDAARDSWRRLVDPVSMHDIVLSRARTLDDPLTTRVLAEITRAEAVSERAQRSASSAPPPAAPPSPAVAAPAAAGASAALDSAATSAADPSAPAAAALDVIVTDPEQAAEDLSDFSPTEEIARPRVRTTRRTIPRLRDEPFRKR